MGEEKGTLQRLMREEKGGRKLSLYIASPRSTPRPGLPLAPVYPSPIQFYFTINFYAYGYDYAYAFKFSFKYNANLFESIFNAYSIPCIFHAYSKSILSLF